MKRSSLQRKKPLRAKCPNFAKKTRKVSSIGKRGKGTSTGRIRAHRGKPATITALKKKLWEQCKRIIRGKYGNTCFTCGKTGLEGSNWHTGHFITSSVCSAEVRYALDNLRPQCYQCNVNLSGNWLAYERRLGKEEAERLKAWNERTKGGKYDRFWYMEKIEEYKQIDI
jgi:hypothetical protein